MCYGRVWHTHPLYPSITSLTYTPDFMFMKSTDHAISVSCGRCSFVPSRRLERIVSVRASSARHSAKLPVKKKKYI